MQELITDTRFGGIIAVLLCVTLLLCALLFLFNDREVRYTGVLTVAIFGGGLIALCAVLELSGLELPDWLIGSGRRKIRGTLLIALWAWCSHKLADRLYYRYLDK
ncbi:MAG: hypothetical protein J6R92_04185 [Akkermansia sp.]|nr:hypothetical protein [Akkermansia sp.]